jgi:hypothetical protein
LVGVQDYRRVKQSRTGKRIFHSKVGAHQVSALLVQSGDFRQKAGDLCRVFTPQATQLMVSLPEVFKGFLEGIIDLAFVKPEHQSVDPVDNIGVGRFYQSTDDVVVTTVQ